MGELISFIGLDVHKATIAVCVAEVDPGNTASRVWADIAYRTKCNLEVLERRGLSGRIQFRKPLRRGLSDQQTKANATRPRIRSGIEHAFAA